MGRDSMTPREQETNMADDKTDERKPDGRAEGDKTPDAGRPQPGEKVTDPHPDTEEGYGKDHPVPMTGL